MTTTQTRTGGLDRDMEAARRNVFALDVAERENQRDDFEVWLRGKTGEFASALRSYLEVYDHIRELDDGWRTQVLRGVEAFDPATDREIRGLYGIWVAISEMFEEKAVYFRRHGGAFDAESDAIERNKLEAFGLLRAWKCPTLSASPSFRAASLSAETTAHVRELFPGAF